MGSFVRRALLAALSAGAVIFTFEGVLADSARVNAGIPDGFFVSGSFDGMNISRSNISGPIAVPVAGTGTVIDANDLRFSDRWGYDARLRAGIGMWSVEGRYLQSSTWNSNLGDLGAVGNVRIGSFSNFGATALSANADSKLQSWEFNLRGQVLPWLTPFIGYREFKTSDRTNLDIAFPAFTALYTFDVPWKAQGVQIGADVHLIGRGTTWQPGPFYVDLDGRAGLYRVRANPDFNLLPSTGGSFPAGTSFSKSSSPIYEVGATVGYEITSNWDIHLGYRLISIQDAMSANGYAISSTANSSQTAVPNRERLNLNMFTIGTRFTY